MNNALNDFKDQRADLLKDFYVTTKSNDVLIAYWTWLSEEIAKRSFKFSQVFYMHEASSAILSSPRFRTANVTQFLIDNLHVDTHYKVCIRVGKQGNLSHLPDDRVCVDASTQLWHLSASIGSSVGAFLALAIIVLLVFLSNFNEKRRGKIRRGGQNSSKRDRYGSAFDSQFDSVGIRDETTIYDESGVMYDNGTFMSVGQPLIITTEEGMNMNDTAYPCSCGFVHVLQSETPVPEDENDEENSEHTCKEHEAQDGEQPSQGIPTKSVKFHLSAYNQSDSGDANDESIPTPTTNVKQVDSSGPNHNDSPVLAATIDVHVTDNSSG